MSETLVETTDPQWRTNRQKRRDGIANIAPRDDAGREFDEEDSIAFLQQLAEGYGPMGIGLELGWSPAMVNRFMADPERKTIIDMIVESNHETVERAIWLEAQNGNSTAMKLYAYNKMSHRGWADRSEVRINHQGQQELVVTVRQEMQRITHEAITRGGSEGVAGLQALGQLTADVGADADDDVVDAEVVE